MKKGNSDSFRVGNDFVVPPRLEQILGNEHGEFNSLLGFSFNLRFQCMYKLSYSGKACQKGSGGMN